MIDIMESLQKYSPCTQLPLVGHDGSEISVDIFHHILFGGDQLTVARARSAQAQRENTDRGALRLEGLIPVLEDWHTQLTLLQVSSIHGLHVIAFPPLIFIFQSICMCILPELV